MKALGRNKVADLGAWLAAGSRRLFSPAIEFSSRLSNMYVPDCRGVKTLFDSVSNYVCIP